MADIRNKNELRRRIDTFLHDFTSKEYAINEAYCKETMRLMAEFIGHVDCRLESADRKVQAEKKKSRELAEYIIKNVHSCPIPVDVNCKPGFQNKGCVACLMKHTDLLGREKEDI